MMFQTHMLVVLMVLGGVPAPDAASKRAGELCREHDAVLAKQAAELKKLSQKLAQEGQAEAAKEVRAAIFRPTGNRGASKYYPVLEVVPARSKNQDLANHSVPAEPGQTTKQPDKDQPGRRSEVDSIHSKTAAALFKLAQQAAKDTQYALASAWVHEVVAHDSDHEDARRILGFVRDEGGWATPYAIRMRKSGKVLHPVFGWVPKAWVPHLEVGELPEAPNASSVTWLPADQANRLHTDLSNPWDIYTEHFHIRATVSLADVITFGRRLEVFHDIFTTLMADMLGPGQPIARRFTKAPVRSASKTKVHQIVYMSSKEQYLDCLRDNQVKADARSLGIYVDGLAKSFFFKNAKGQIEDTATLYHETAHQLIFELAGKNNYKGNPADYWVFEGFGTYFETLVQEHDGSVSLGGLVGPRIDQAILRIIDRKEYIPIETLVKLNLARFFATDDVGDVFLKYAESMAFAVFLLQYQEGTYRVAFLDYLEDAFKGRLGVARGRSLSARLGVSYETLDREFREYLKKAKSD